jgi:hypothetical protein
LERYLAQHRRDGLIPEHAAEEEEEEEEVKDAM